MAEEAIRIHRAAFAERDPANLKWGDVGADVVVDARYGPVVLELNARPGLAIQLANRAGLRPRLEFVDASYPGLAVGERAPGSFADRIEAGRQIAKENP